MADARYEVVRKKLISLQNLFDELTTGIITSERFILQASSTFESFAEDFRVHFYDKISNLKSHEQRELLLVTLIHGEFLRRNLTYDGFISLLNRNLPANPDDIAAAFPDPSRNYLAPPQLSWRRGGIPFQSVYNVQLIRDTLSRMRRNGNAASGSIPSGNTVLPSQPVIQQIPQSQQNLPPNRGNSTAPTLREDFRSTQQLPPLQPQNTLPRTNNFGATGTQQVPSLPQQNTIPGMNFGGTQQIQFLPQQNTLPRTYNLGGTQLLPTLPQQNALQRMSNFGGTQQLQPLQQQNSLPGGTQQFPALSQQNILPGMNTLAGPSQYLQPQSQSQFTVAGINSNWNATVTGSQQFSQLPPQNTQYVMNTNLNSTGSQQLSQLPPQNMQYVMNTNLSSTGPQQFSQLPLQSTQSGINSNWSTTGPQQISQMPSQDMQSGINRNLSATGPQQFSQPQDKQAGINRRWSATDPTLLSQIVQNSSPEENLDYYSYVDYIMGSNVASSQDTELPTDSALSSYVVSSQDTEVPTDQQKSNSSSLFSTPEELEQCFPVFVKKCLELQKRLEIEYRKREAKKINNFENLKVLQLAVRHQSAQPINLHSHAFIRLSNSDNFGPLTTETHFGIQTLQVPSSSVIQRVYWDLYGADPFSASFIVQNSNPEPSIISTNPEMQNTIAQQDREFLPHPTEQSLETESQRQPNIAEHIPQHPPEQLLGTENTLNNTQDVSNISPSQHVSHHQSELNNLFMDGEPTYAQMTQEGPASNSVSEYQTENILNNPGHFGYYSTNTNTSSNISYSQQHVSLPQSEPNNLLMDGEITLTHAETLPEELPNDSEYQTENILNNPGHFGYYSTNASSNISHSQQHVSLPQSEPNNLLMDEEITLTHAETLPEELPNDSEYQTEYTLTNPEDFNYNSTNLTSNVSPSQQHVFPYQSETSNLWMDGETTQTYAETLSEGLPSNSEYQTENTLTNTEDFSNFSADLHSNISLSQQHESLYQSEPSNPWMDGETTQTYAETPPEWLPSNSEWTPNNSHYNSADRDHESERMVNSLAGPSNGTANNSHYNSADRDHESERMVNSLAGPSNEVCPSLELKFEFNPEATPFTPKLSKLPSAYESGSSLTSIDSNLQNNNKQKYTPPMITFGDYISTAQTVKKNKKNKKKKGWNTQSTENMSGNSNTSPNLSLSSVADQISSNLNNLNLDNNNLKEKEQTQNCVSSPSEHVQSNLSPTEQAETSVSLPDQTQSSVSPPEQGQNIVSPSNQTSINLDVIHQNQRDSRSCDAKKKSSIEQAQNSVSPSRQAQNSVSPSRQAQSSVSPSRQAQSSLSPSQQAQSSVSPSQQAQSSLSPSQQAQSSLSPSQQAQSSLSPSQQTQSSVSPSQQAQRSSVSQLEQGQNSVSPSNQTSNNLNVVDRNERGGRKGRRRRR